MEYSAVRDFDSGEFLSDEQWPFARPPIVGEFIYSDQGFLKVVLVEHYPFDEPYTVINVIPADDSDRLLDPVLR